MHRQYFANSTCSELLCIGILNCEDQSVRYSDVLTYAVPGNILMYASEFSPSINRMHVLFSI